MLFRLATVVIFLVYGVSTHKDMIIERMVHNFDPNDNQSKMINKFTVIHTLIRSEHFFKHILWMFYPYPTIIFASTFSNCSLNVDYAQWINGNFSKSLTFMENKKQCEVNQYYATHYYYITENNENGVLKKYNLSNIEKITYITHNDSNVMSIHYESSFIKLKFSSVNNETEYDKSRLYILSPSNNLVSLTLTNLTVKSRNSFFKLHFYLYDKHNILTRIDSRRFTNDILAHGVFRSFQINFNENSSNSNDQYYFYWQDSAYSEEERPRHSIISASPTNISEHITISKYSYFNGQIIQPSFYAIEFLCINVENNFLHKKYLTWDGLVGYGHLKNPIIPSLLKIFTYAVYSIPIIVTILAVIIIFVISRRDPYAYAPIGSESDFDNDS